MGYIGTYYTCATTCRTPRIELFLSCFRPSKWTQNQLILDPPNWTPDLDPQNDPLQMTPPQIQCS